VESPKYKCGCRSGKSCFLTYDQAQAEISVPSAEWRRHSFFRADAILPKMVIRDAHHQE
jgi:hypothetical protein